MKGPHQPSYAPIYTRYPYIVHKSLSCLFCRSCSISSVKWSPIRLKHDWRHTSRTKPKKPIRTTEERSPSPQYFYSYSYVPTGRSLPRKGYVVKLSLYFCHSAALTRPLPVQLGFIYVAVLVHPGGWHCLRRLMLNQHRWRDNLCLVPATFFKLNHYW